MGRPRSIGLYSPYFGSVYGGGEKYLASVARTLADGGHEVELVAPVPIDAAAYERAGYVTAMRAANAGAYNPW